MYTGVHWQNFKHHKISQTFHIHWNENVFILINFSSLAALEVVKMTTSNAASDENFVKMTTFSFQCTIAQMIM